MNVLVSACLLGVNCTYNGTGKTLNCLEELMKKHTLIPVCPEIFGGLPTPRIPVEIRAGRAVTKDQNDVTEAFQKGAQEVLKLAELYQCRYAILKERSPSCGKSYIYDGTFTGKQIPGDGILVQLLESSGISCIRESDARKLL